MTQVNVSIESAIGTLEMSNDAKRNSLSRGFLSELSDGFEECRQRGARVVILRARRGSTVWSAGHDVEELPERGIDPLGPNDPLPRFTRLIEEFPAPVIASVEGTVWGGACQVAFTCDLVIATAGSTFALTPARLGVPYHLSGLATFVHCLGPQVAREMAFTGQPLSAERLHDLGVVNRIVTAAELETVTHSVAAEIAGNAPLAISSMKQQIHALVTEHAVSAESLGRIEASRRVAYSSNDYVEGIAAFKSRRRPRFNGH